MPSKSKPMNWKFGFDHYSFKATDPLDESPLWTDEEKELNKFPNSFSNKVSLSFDNLIPNAPVDFLYDFNFLTHNMHKNRKISVDNSMMLGLLFKSAGERTKNYGGPVIDLSSAHPFTTVDEDSVSTNRYGLVFGSELGEKEKNYLKSEFTLLAPSNHSDSGLLALKIKFNYSMDNFFEQFYLNMDSIQSLDRNKNLDQALKRRFSKNGRQYDFEVGFNKIFYTKTARIRISPFIGTSSSDFGVLNPGDKDNIKADHLTSGKSGIRVTWETPHYDISASLSYFDSRVH